MTLWMTIGLILAGLIAMFIELFVPAGGIIGIAGIVCFISGIVLTFIHFNTAVGIATLAVALVTVPVFFVLAFKLFPRSPIGRRLILNDRQKAEAGFTSYTGDVYRDLVGEEGLVLTQLRPSGMARIGGRKYSVVTGGEFIERGARVRVNAVEGSRIVVRRLDSN